MLPTEERAAAQSARLRSRYQRLGLRIGRLPSLRERGEPGRTAAEPARAESESGLAELDVALVGAALERDVTERSAATLSALADSPTHRPSLQR